MLTVKGAVSLMPDSLKKGLKRNRRLTEFYSQSLHRSGLFYGRPSNKKLQMLYQQRLSVQEAELALLPDSQSKLLLFISGTDRTAIEASIDAISNKEIDWVSIYVDDSININKLQISHQKITILSYSSYQNENNIPVFCIRAGDLVIESRFAKVLSKSLETDASIVYFDWHHSDRRGKAINEQLLPDWNPDYQLSAGYIKTAVLLLKPGSLFDLSKPTDLRTDLSWWIAGFHNRNFSIGHLAYSVLACNQTMPAVTSDLNKIASAAGAGASAVINDKAGVVSQMWKLDTSPLVSLIIPTFNGKELVKACIESILNKTTYNNYEILLIDNNSDDPECLKYFSELSKHKKVRMLKYPHPFNYSAINNFAVEHANGEIIGLINNDIEVITPQWLEFLAGHAIREEIGCVGAKLLYSDERIQHAGVVLGYGGGAGHAHKYFPRQHPGYMNRLIATQNYSAVTAACLFVKKSKYLEVGGLNEVDLHVAFNDVDFCLKVLETGVRNLYCAEAELYHHESVSRGLDISEEKAARFNRELKYLKTKWDKYIKQDPAYNRNLTLKRENFAIKGRNE